jgi:hypothetical protein
MSETSERECVRIVGDRWFVVMGRNPRSREPEHAWKIVAHQSARSERRGDRLVARDQREDRSGAWGYRMNTLAVERQLPNGEYVYDFPGGTRVSGAKLYPILEWVLATPHVHPTRHLPVGELNRVLKHGGPPSV